MKTYLYKNIEKIKRYLMKNYQDYFSIFTVALSGSYKYANPDEFSDIDLDIIFHQYPQFSLLDFKNELTKELGKNNFIDIQPYYMPELSLFNNQYIDTLTLDLLQKGYVIKNMEIILDYSKLLTKIQENLGNFFEINRFKIESFLICNYMLIGSEIFWNLRKHKIRNDKLSFDLNLSKILMQICYSFYLINNEFIPPDKWIIANLKSLKKPYNAYDLIKQIAESNTIEEKFNKVFYLFLVLEINLLNETQFKFYDIQKLKKIYHNLIFEEHGIGIPDDFSDLYTFYKDLKLKNNILNEELFENLSNTLLESEVQRIFKEDYKKREFYEKLKLELESFNGNNFNSTLFEKIKNLINPLLITTLMTSFFINFNLTKKLINFDIKNQEIIETKNIINNNLNYQNIKINKPISITKELPEETLVPDQKIFPLDFLKGTLTSLNKELPKVTGSNPDWYLLEKQPLEAIIREIQKVDIRVYIGNTTAKINDQEYKLDATPYIKEGRTLVPLRFIAEGLGATVGWDGVERKVILDYEGSTIELWIGKKQARVNGVEYVLDVPPEIKSGRTFVPIRFIAENFGSKVDWNSTLKEVSIIKEKEVKKIDENSDADKDGVVFKEEKNLGTNPNDKNTIYNFLTDKQLLELKRKYPTLNIFAQYPDGITKLTLPEKAQFGLNPVSAFSLDQNINDEIIVNYALNKKPDLKTGEELKNIWQEFNTKYSSFIEALKENLNLETISKIDSVGDLVLNFKKEKLDEKLKATISKEYIERVISEIEEFNGIAPITSIFDKEFVNSNKEYFLELKNSSLEFIASMLSKYPELTIEKQIELKKKYQELDFSKRETFENPDKETGLTLLEKIKLNINPLNPYNFDNILNDKLAIEYTKSKGLEITKDNIIKIAESIIKNYGEKLGSAIKQTTKLGITQPNEIDIEAQTAKTQVENMFSERAYKKKADGTQITLEELTSIERYKALIALNKTFASEDINILLSQSKTLQEYVNNNRVSELKEIVDTLYKASNSVELTLNKKVKDTTTFKEYVNQTGLYDYNAGELAVLLWKNADDAIKAEIKSHPKTFLAIVAGFGPYADAGKITYESKEYDFQDSTITTGIAEWASKLFNYYVETEKIFREQKSWLFKIGYNRGLEFYDFIIMQGLIPGTIANFDNGGFYETLKNRGLKEALSQTLNITEEMKKIRDLVIEKYHNVTEKGYKIDWLDPIIGPAQISLKMNWLGLFKTGEKGIPYGVILKEGEGKKLTDKEAAAKIAQLLNPTNKEVFETNQFGLVQLENVVMKALATPMIEGKYEYKGKIKVDSASLLLMLDDATKKKIGNIFGLTNINSQKYHYIEKFPWSEMGMGTSFIDRTLSFRKGFSDVDKSWIRITPLPFSVQNPADLDGPSLIYQQEKIFSVFKGINSF